MIIVFWKNARPNLGREKILMSLSTAEASGTTWVAVKSGNICKNTGGEGGLLGLY